MTYHPSHILIFGANSGIAAAVAELYATRNAALHLVARNPDKLRTLAEKLRSLGAAAITTAISDLNDIASHDRLIHDAMQKLGKIDLALIAHGSLSDQKICAQDWDAAALEIQTNFTSAASLAARLANQMESHGAGTIAVITSVAGDRGRASNYVYGAAKAGMSSFLQGLRARLFSKGVHVLTIKPGPVDTPLLDNHPEIPRFLRARVAPVATGIVRAIAKKKNVVYLPGYWRLVMFLVRMLPESAFKRLGPN